MDERATTAGTVAVVESERRAGLDRLVVPRDRVRADAPLPVVDDSALVEHAQQDHAPVELEQVRVVEPRQIRRER
jgi:hypothetical protein